MKNTMKCGASYTKNMLGQNVLSGMVVTDLPLEVLRALRDSVDAAIKEQEAKEAAERSKRCNRSTMDWLNSYLGMDDDDWDDDEDEDEDDDYDDDEYDSCENCHHMTCRGCRLEE